MLQDVSVTWPLGIFSKEIMQSTECEQAIRSPRTALRAKEPRKAILTSRIDRHSIPATTAGVKGGEKTEGEDASLMS